MNALRGLVLLAVVLEVGCVGGRAACPSEGGKPWREVRSAHFRVVTDLESEPARQTALELEQLRQGLLLAWHAGFDPPGTVEVVVLRNPAEFEEFYRQGIEGISTWSGSSPLLLLKGRTSLSGEGRVGGVVAAHELTHYLSQFAMPRQPLWFAEGLAGYAQTIHLWGQPPRLSLGQPSSRTLSEVHQHGWAPLEQLWDWRSIEGLDAFAVRRAYTSSWLWVHYLLDVHPKPFAEFQRRLGRLEAPRQAFEAAFKDVGELNSGLSGYVDRGQYAVLTGALPTGLAFSAEERGLECADIHTLRARLRLVDEPDAFVDAPALRQQRSEEDLSRALREDPTHEGAVVLRASLTPDVSQRLALARELLRARPDSGPAWLLLAQSLEDAHAPVTEREQAWTRALELAPQGVEVLTGRARFDLERGRLPQALEWAQRAVALSPGDANALATEAAVYFQSGQCPESLTFQQRALEALHDSASRTARQGLEETLARYEKACQRPSGVTSSRAPSRGARAGPRADRASPHRPGGPC